MDIVKELLGIAVDLTDGTGLSDLLTKGTGTWGINPENLANGLNKYLKDNKIKGLNYSVLYSDDVDFSTIRDTIFYSLRDNFPVILLIVGDTEMYDVSDATREIANLHNVNIVKIVWDRISDNTTVYCSSWSKCFSFNLNNCWNSVAYWDDITGKFGHEEMDSFLWKFFGAKHAIITPFN